MAINLDLAAAERVLEVYDYARKVRLELRRRRLIRPNAGVLPIVQLPVDIEVTFHSFAKTDEGGWDFSWVDSWMALPMAFRPNALGAPLFDLDDIRLEPCLQLCQWRNTAMFRIYTDICGDVPEFFQTEDFPIEVLRRWTTSGIWGGEFLPNDSVDYGDS
ncbi:MAG: hypothetical protein JSR48_00725 [Verrucomicrobia bacterium]|nr:hypothetical protein [Verrucomicrobiota bacterium]